MTIPNAHLISPKFSSSKATPGTFKDWVDIWEDRIWGWQLLHAQALRNQDINSAVAALHLAIAFIEPYEVFRTGELSEGKSKAAFRSGFIRIVTRNQASVEKELGIVADAVYSQIRCGLFHAGMPGILAYLSTASEGVQVTVDLSTGAVTEITINPCLFVDMVIGEFRWYVNTLRDSADPMHSGLRAPFEKAWHLVHRRD